MPSRLISVSDGFGTETNPFKRKNPPAANGLGVRGSIQKSDSFFDKVEAAESVSGKKPKKPAFKSKDKEGPKQTTLFGMMPRSFQTSQAPKKGTEEEKPSQGDDDDFEETQPDEMESFPETLDEGESQMMLNDSRGLEETQLEEESQMD